MAIVAPDGDLVIFGSRRPKVPMPFGPLLMRNAGVRLVSDYDPRFDVQRR